MLKEYSTLVKKIEVVQHLPDFEIEAGIYKNDEYECFIIEVTDLRNGEVNKYINSFNSSSCYEKEWLGQVLANQLYRTVQEATWNTKMSIKSSYDKFRDTLR